MTETELHERFVNIRKLGNNWNGYGAEPIPEATINRAEKIAIVLMNSKMSVFPTAGDFIQIEFENCGTYVEIDVYEDREEIYCEIGEQ